MTNKNYNEISPLIEANTKSKAKKGIVHEAHASLVWNMLPHLNL